jgi:hypothetical protein
MWSPANTPVRSLGRPIQRTVDSAFDDAINRAYDRGMPALTANDLKTRGIVAIEESLARQPEAVISVRGKDRFVVMEVAQYHYLRECELDAALAESRADEAAGRYVSESAQAHMARLDRLLEPPEATRQAPVARRRPGRKTAAKSGRATSAR